METVVGLAQGAGPLALLIGAFAGLAATEALWPRRPGPVGRARRWGANGALFLINGYLHALLAFAAALPMAVLAERAGWGLLQLATVPAWLAVPVAVVGTDLAFYGRHRLLHAVPALWRLHQVHHDDRAVDASTGFRFHPLEALLDLLTWSAVVLALGAPPVAVAVTKLLMITGNLFQHANLTLPPGLDRHLRRLVVTPDMHRVHHSRARAEADSNYGVIFPWWDRLFGSYRAQPSRGHRGMAVGVAGRNRPAQLALPGLLVAPFRPGLRYRAEEPATGEDRLAT
mgnify:CR=1 FL=1